MRISHSMKSYQTGRQAIEKGDVLTARTAFRWAVGQDPENPVYTYAAATAALKAGREDEAETLLRQAMDDTVGYLGHSHPHLVTVVHMLAQLYLKQAREEDAHRLCGEIVRNMDPDSAAAGNSRTLRRLAMLFRTAGRPRDAVGLYRRALMHRRGKYGDTHPKVAECLAGLAEVHNHLGSHDKARALLKLSAQLAGAQAESGDPGKNDSPPVKPRP